MTVYSKGRHYRSGLGGPLRRYTCTQRIQRWGQLITVTFRCFLFVTVESW